MYREGLTHRFYLERTAPTLKCLSARVHECEYSYSGQSLESEL